MSSRLVNPMAGHHVNLTDAGWRTENGVSVKGSAYRGGTLWDAGGLCAVAQTITGEVEFASFLKDLNGFFSIVIERGQRIFAAVDIIRSIPLFYAEDNGAVSVSDNAESLRERVGSGEASELIRLEFLLAGYVTGRDTLAPGVKQLQAGEFLAHHGGRDWQTRKYFSFESRPSLPNDKALLREKLDQVNLGAVERLVQWAAGRTIVIPLSGGFDSRLLCVLLKQIGYDSVLTYTYGSSESAEARVAREVAKSLGFSCRFIEYTQEAWWQWFHSAERKAYFRFAHNLASIPHIQDWPAVWALRRDRLVPEDAVIVPGHSGDFVAGSHIPKTFCEVQDVTKDHFVSEVMSKHYALWRWRDFKPQSMEQIRERIVATSEFGPSESCSFEDAANKYEAWDWRERQAKLIVNSLRVYDFWGYEWWLPYFDACVADYWSRVPYEWRIGCRLYEEYVVDKYAAAAGLSREAASLRAPMPRIDTFTWAKAPYLTARALYHLVTTEKLRRRIHPERSYERHPLAIYGIMDKENFMRYWNEFQNFHSLISKATLEGDFF